MNYKKELDKVMSKNGFFVYRGVVCERLIGGFRVLGKICKKEEIDGIIDASMDKLLKSIK